MRKLNKNRHIVLISIFYLGACRFFLLSSVATFLSSLRLNLSSFTFCSIFFIFFDFFFFSRHNSTFPLPPSFLFSFPFSPKLPQQTFFALYLHRPPPQPMSSLIDTALCADVLRYTMSFMICATTIARCRRVCRHWSRSLSNAAFFENSGADAVSIHRSPDQTMFDMFASMVGWKTSTISIQYFEGLRINRPNPVAIDMSRVWQHTPCLRQLTLNVNCICTLTNAGSIPRSVRVLRIVGGGVVPYEPLMAMAEALPDLEELAIEPSVVFQPVLVTFLCTSFPKLTKLSISLFYDLVLEHPHRVCVRRALAGPFKLRELRLNCAAMEDAALLDIVQRESALETLALHRVVGVTNQGIADALTLCPGIRNLTIIECDSITGSVLALSHDALEHLHYLHVSLTPTGWEDYHPEDRSVFRWPDVHALLCAAKRLRELTLSGVIPRAQPMPDLPHDLLLRVLRLDVTMGDTSGVAVIIDRCPHLEQFFGDYVSRDDECFSVFARCPRLRAFYAPGGRIKHQGSQISNAIMEIDTPRPDLRVLDLSSSDVTDSALCHIARLAPGLHSITLNDCDNITEEGLASVRAILPRLTLLCALDSLNIRGDSPSMITNVYASSPRYMGNRLRPQVE